MHFTKWLAVTAEHRLGSGRLQNINVSHRTSCNRLADKKKKKRTKRFQWQQRSEI